jgi:hypothetical protein
VAIARRLGRGAGHGVRGHAAFAELANPCQPNRLDRGVRGENDGAPAYAADHLDAHERLSRSGRRHDVGVSAALLAVALESLEGEPLIVAPLALEPEHGERVTVVAGHAGFTLQRPPAA